MKKKRIHLGDILFVLVTSLFAIIVIIPCLNVAAKALSSPGEVIRGAVTIYPRGFQLDTIKYVVSRSEFLNGAKVSVFVTVVGTLFALLLTVTAAYPLSKPHLKGRKFILGIFVFTMLFNAGMVPKYILYSALGLTNTIWALVLGFSVYNMLIVKNYFEALPDSIEEAAKIDGATNFQILWKVIIPMSTPVIATIALFYGVSYWNDYFTGVLYITDPKLKSLQQYLYDLISMAKSSSEDSGVMDIASQEAFAAISGENIQCATILVSTLPILVLYPFLQRYFVSGITIGSVKG